MAVRFGLQIPSFSFPKRSDENVFLVARDIAREAENMGFDSLWLMDHLFQIPIVAPRDGPAARLLDDARGAGGVDLPGEVGDARVLRGLSTPLRAGQDDGEPRRHQ